MQPFLIFKAKVGHTKLPFSSSWKLEVRPFTKWKTTGLAAVLASYRHPLITIKQAGPRIFPPALKLLSVLIKIVLVC